MARRSKKEPIAFDPEEVKNFIQRLFSIEQEIKGLRDDKKELKKEYSDKVDMKLVMNIIKLVKAQMKIEVSEETKEQLATIVLDKINMFVD